MKRRVRYSVFASFLAVLRCHMAAVTLISSDRQGDAFGRDRRSSLRFVSVLASLDLN
jgi:hypothetical protein